MRLCQMVGCGNQVNETVSDHQMVAVEVETE